jgi:hypothetical protein
VKQSKTSNQRTLCLGASIEQVWGGGRGAEWRGAAASCGGGMPWPEPRGRVPAWPECASAAAPLPCALPLGPAQGTIFQSGVTLVGSEAQLRAALANNSRSRFIQVRLPVGRPGAQPSPSRLPLAASARRGCCAVAVSACGPVAAALSRSAPRRPARVAGPFNRSSTTSSSRPRCGPRALARSPWTRGEARCRSATGGGVCRARGCPRASPPPQRPLAQPRVPRRAPQHH